MEDEMDKLKFEIPGKPSYLTMVRLAISSVATSANFDIDSIEDIKTAVTEACKRISCHGFEGFSDKYELKLEVEEKHIEIDVTDECDKHTLEKVDKPCKMCPQDGDLSLMVIKSLVNDVRVTTSEKNGRKSIHMTKLAE